MTVTADRGGNGILSGYVAPDASTGALGKKALLDTPFSISVTTDDYIADQQATNLADAFKYDAAIQAASNNVAGETTLVTIRGLQLDPLNGIKIDGLNTAMWMSDLPVEHFSQIELLKGLSGFMYGFSAPGGTANYRLKRATQTPVTAVEVGYGTESQYQLSADVGRRFGDDDRFGVRVTAVHEGGDTYLDTPIKRDSISGAFDVKLTDNLSWSIDGLYQKRKVNGSAFMMAVSDEAAMPSPIDGDRLLTQDFSYYQTAFSTVGTEVRWDINDNWNMRVAARTALMKRTNYDSYLYVEDSEGNYSDDLYSWYSEHKSDSANLLFNGKLSTGSIQHELTFGTDLQKVKRTAGTALDEVLGNGNLYTGREEFTDPNLPLMKDMGTIWETRNVGVFLSDTIQWSPEWSTIIGLRQNFFRQTSPDATYEKNAVTPTLAAIWKPDPSISYYLSYVEGLEKGGTADVEQENAGQTFAPKKSKQYELGLKKLGLGWSVEAAVFRTERALEYVNADNYFTQDGSLNFTGLDLGGRVELGRDWALIGSVVAIKSRNESDDPLVDGKQAAGTPKFSSSLQAEYRVPVLAGLILTGGASYVSDRQLEASNIHTLGSYQLFDLGGRYETKLGGAVMTLRANIDNLTNEKYWLSSGDWGTLTQGAPRTFRVSAEVNF
ncbi:TonB-dependent siderophore receptor [Jeongeupia wiesaeckerbachi]|uniref:TonB-dependent siderophore receptor n=1 Tax=Jeongeupia wiesaeckerbachi TaxID=3051218 RepID=UPI003D801DEE